MKINSEKFQSQILNLHLLPYPFKGAVIFSFDFETSAQTSRVKKISTVLRGKTDILLNKIVRKYPKDLSYYLGRGYANRIGAINILNILNEFGIKGTWFSTGHVLLKENINKNNYRINQILDYATREAGFTDLVTWRKNKKSFIYDPFSDYKRNPYWYFGDIVEYLLKCSQDVQTHTFSHPYVPLEPAENIYIDLEDWQFISNRLYGIKSNVIAFPFQGDVYNIYPDLGLKTMLHVKLKDKEYQRVFLDSSQIEALKKNGIHYLTRCGSKEGLFNKGFEKYYDLPFLYVSDFPIFRLTEDDFEIKLSEIYDNGYLVDFWCHPNNVFHLNEINKYKKFIQIAYEFFKKGKIWLVTFRDIIERFEKIENINVEFDKSYSDNVIGINVINKNKDDIFNLAIEVDEKYTIQNHSPNISFNKNILVIKKIKSEEKIFLQLTKR